MIREGAYLPMSELLEELRRLCADRASGTVFIATPENRSARIVLREGRIVGLNYRAKRGMGSVQMIREMVSGRIGFTQGLAQPVGGDQDLPATPVLLGLLEGRSSASDASASSGGVGAGLADAGIDLAEARRIMEEELIEFLGPVAGFACQEEFAGLPGDAGLDDLVDMIDRILREAGESQHSREVVDSFIARLRRR